MAPFYCLKVFTDSRLILCQLHDSCLNCLCSKPLNMKHTLRYSLFLAGFFIVICAQSQTLKSLEENNGFKKYKLGSKFVLGYGVKGKQPDGSDKIVIDYAKEFIGDIPVKTIELYYIRDTLAKIVVKITPEYYAKLIDAVRNSFGSPTQDLSSNDKVKFDSLANTNYYKDDFIWKASKIRLEYLYVYPKTGAGSYGVRDLALIYSLNDLGLRLQRGRATAGAAKNF